MRPPDEGTRDRAAEPAGIRSSPRLSTAAVLALASLVGCAGEDLAGPGDVPGPVPAVEAALARSGSLPLEERLSGVVKAQNQVAIRPEISAPVTEVLVRSGDAVERGQPLVRLQEDTLRDQLRQSEAALRLAEAQAREARARVAELEAQVTRTRALAEEELVSRLRVETQEAQLEAAEAAAAQDAARVEQARATVRERRTAMARSVVRAPVSGRVGQRNAEVGMLVDPGTVLFLIGNLEQVRVEIPLTEAMLSHIEEGLPVRLASESLAEPLRAELSRISPFLEEGNFSTVGEIDVDNRDGRLRPGMFLTADVLYGESERSTLIPTAALWEDPRTGVLGVFVVGGMDGVAPPAEPIDETSERLSKSPPDVAPAESPESRRAEPIPKTVHPAGLRPVEVLAEGRGTTGVRGIEPGEWVVTVGQQLLAGKESPRARVRPVTWERVFQLQALQREDLLRGFLERQRRSARERGAEIPSSAEYLGAAGRAERSGESSGGETATTTGSAGNAAARP